MKKLTTYEKVSNVICTFLFLSIIASVIGWVWNFDTYHFKWVVTTIILFIAALFVNEAVERLKK